MVYCMCIYIEPARNCTSDEFQCDGDSCILKSWRCDKEHDCKDGTDEANCSEYTCTIVHLSHFVFMVPSNRVFL